MQAKSGREADIKSPPIKNWGEIIRSPIYFKKMGEIINFPSTFKNGNNHYYYIHSWSPA